MFKKQNSNGLYEREASLMSRVDLNTGLYEKSDFEKRLAMEIKVASVRDAELAVMAVVPRLLPGEGAANIVRTAAGCVRNLIRDEDVAGHMDGDILAVGLPNCDRVNADALASRMQSELRMFTAKLRNTNWEVGVACLGEDGETMEDLVTAAIDIARNKRRNYASQTPTYAVQIPPALGEFGKL